MKKIGTLIILALLAISCEKDDFCVDPVTPNLVIRFYDANDQTELKSVSNLYVWPEGRDSVVVNAVTDSIAIPLDVTNGQTTYNLSNGTIQDQITIDYTTQEVFVSRSCGFKAIFNNVTFTPVITNWITTISPTTVTSIENESAAHVQIFH